MNIEEKMNALMGNEEFERAFEQVKNADDVVALYARYGVEVPVEIAQELFESVPTTDSELLESDLENVAGGGIIRAYVYSAIGWGLGYCNRYVYSRVKGDSRRVAEEKATKMAKKTAKAGFVAGALTPGL